VLTVEFTGFGNIRFEIAFKPFALEDVNCMYVIRTNTMWHVELITDNTFIKRIRFSKKLIKISHMMT